MFFWSVFTVGLFFGEWLIDLSFNIPRDSLASEMVDSIIVGLIVALLIIGNKVFNKNK